MKKTFNLFGDIADAPKLSKVSIELLFGDPDQPRTEFDEEGLLELADSIRDKGILQAPLVRPNPSGDGYLIIAGERRCRAAKLAGLSEIDVRVYEKDDFRAISLIENLQRLDLKPVEEARGLKKLLNEDKTLNQTKLAEMLGKNRLTILALLKIAELPEYVQDESLKLNTPKTILIELANHKDEAVIGSLWGKAREGDLTVFDIRQYGKEAPAPDLAKEKPATAPKSKAVKKQIERDKIIQTGFSWLSSFESLDKKSLKEDDKATLIELKNKIAAAIDKILI